MCMYLYEHRICGERKGAGMIYTLSSMCDTSRESFPWPATDALWLGNYRVFQQHKALKGKSHRNDRTLIFIILVQPAPGLPAECVAAGYTHTHLGSGILQVWFAAPF